MQAGGSDVGLFCFQGGGNMAKPVLELAGVSKRYGGIVALEDVDFQASSGSIHAILGENGAGKSTLMKVLAGTIRPSGGQLNVDGKTVDFRSPTEAASAGVICIFQELSVIPDLSVAANVCLASPPTTRFGLIDRRKQRQITRDIFAEMGVGQDIDVDAQCSELPLSKRQLVEIAKALVRKPRVLILDEATSALTASDVQPVMNLLRKLRDDGVLILFISHRMHEIDQLADTCSVFRNGRHVETYKNGERTDQQVVQMMIGRPIEQIFPKKRKCSAQGPKKLSVSNLCWSNRLKDISFNVHAGEIVGLGGLDGQGQQELLEAVAGLLIGSQGEIVLSNGVDQETNGSFAMVSEDRKTGGLFLPLSVRRNLTATGQKQFSSLGVVNRRKERSYADELVDKLQIKVGDLESAVDTLSGGNQQKVVLAKWLAVDPDVLLLVDPTRGIDVGTKQEIYRLLRELADAGKAILIYSTDYDELIGLCDRALIVYDGQLSACLEGDMLTEENILSNALRLGDGGIQDMEAIA